MQRARTRVVVFAVCAAVAFALVSYGNKVIAMGSDHEDAAGTERTPPAADAQVKTGSGAAKGGSSGTAEPGGDEVRRGAGEVPIGVPLSDEEWRALKQRARQGDPLPKE